MRTASTAIGRGSVGRRRRGVRVVAALMAVAVVAACGPPPTAGPGAPDVEIGVSEGPERPPSEDLPDCPVDALDDADGPVEVEFWHTEADVPARVLASLVDDYNASQDRVRVTLQHQGSFDELFAKYVGAIPTDELPDMVEIEDTKILQLIDTGTVLPAEACAVADGTDLTDLHPGLFSYFDVGRMYWPVWVAATAPIMIYKRGDMEAAGLDPDDPPTTLAEVREVAEALRDAGVSDQPVSIDLSRWWPETWLSGAGVPIVDERNGRTGRATESLYDNPTTVEIYEWIDDMVADGLMLAVEAGSIDHITALVQDVSLTFTSSGALTIIDSFLTADPELAERLDGAVGPFPGLEEAGRTRVNAGGFFLVNRSEPEVQAAVWDFSKWLNEPAQEVRWQIEGSYLPVHGSVADGPELQDFYRDDRVGQQLAVAARTLADVDPEFPGPLMGPYVGFTRVVEDSLAAMVFGDASPAEAVAQADEGLQEELDRYNG